MHRRIVVLLDAIARMDRDALEQWAKDNGIDAERFLAYDNRALVAALAGHAGRMIARAANVPPEPPEWLRAVTERVKRAMGLQAVPDAPGIWRVTGGREEHWVNLADPHAPPCDCGDAIWRERICKHVIAARCASGEDLHAVVRDIHQREATREASHALGR